MTPPSGFEPFRSQHTLKKANFAKRPTTWHLESFLSTAFTKWPFRLVPQESRGLSAPRAKPPVNHLLPQLGDKQLCRESPRCAAAHQPGNSLRLCYSRGLRLGSGNTSFIAGVWRFAFFSFSSHTAILNVTELINVELIKK